jgi:multiple sugar transport system ATP-binding protein
VPCALGLVPATERSPMSTVELKNIFKKFDQTEVLHNINLSVPEGEFVVLVGPSGCGKSTTLRLIAGLEEVTEGEVIIDGNVVNMIEPNHRNIAMVFQNYALYPHKNVRENIIFGLKRARVSKDIIETRLKKAAKMLELEELLDRKPAQLSGGQRQRVAMGRVIVRDANLFLFDEPLSNLDAKLRNKMRGEIRKIHREFKTTSIYVTHDQVEAMTLGDRVVVMKDGRIEQQGTPMEIYLNPSSIFVATFIGAPAMNIMNARLYPEYIDFEGQKLSTGTRFRDCEISESGKDIRLGIRPDFFIDEKNVQPGSGYAIIKDAVIDLVEPLGFDREIDASIGSQHIKAKLDLRTTAEEGEKINLCFYMERAHFFDPETGESIFPTSYP